MLSRVPLALVIAFVLALVLPAATTSTAQVRTTQPTMSEHHPAASPHDSAVVCCDLAGLSPDACLDACDGLAAAALPRTLDLPGRSDAPPDGTSRACLTGLAGPPDHAPPRRRARY